MVPIMYILHYGYRNPYPTCNIASKHCCMEIAHKVVGSQLTDWAFCLCGDDSTGVAGWWHKPSGLTVINLEKYNAASVVCSKCNVATKLRISKD